MLNGNNADTLKSQLSAIYCRECNRIVEVEEESNYGVYCEDCGDHSAWKCPYCQENIDYVRNDLEV